MQVTVLGCSGTLPGATTPCAGYLVEHDGYRLVLDLGNGSLGPLQQATGLLDLDAVLISHLHGDHFLDLVPYVYGRRYHPDGPVRPLPLFGPAALPERLLQALGKDGAARDLLDHVYEIRTSVAGDLELGPFRLRLLRMNHPVECYGVRLEADGRSLAYSADTGETPALVALADGVDLALVEATYAHGDPNPPDVHLTGRQAGEHAARAGAGRLLLTHVVPWGRPEDRAAEAAEVFDGPVDVARSGAVVRV